MKIGLRIKERRKELRISAEELGARLGKDRSTIYRYESGEIENLPLDILDPIAEALQTTPEYLMGWDKEKKPAENGRLTEKQKMLMDIVQSLPPEKEDLILRTLQAILADDL